MKKKIMFCMLVLIILGGCQNRSVTQVVSITPSESTQAPPLTTGISEVSATETSIEPSSEVPISLTTEGSQLTPATTNPSNAEPTTGATQTTTTAIGSMTTTEAPIILAKSEDLGEMDETTVILNEIDDLLDSALKNLDQLEADTLIDDTTTEGGLN